MKNIKEGSMSESNDKLEKNQDRQEEVIATLINPIHVFSGAVSSKDYVTAQKQLIRDFGEDIYFNWQLEILHAEIASIIEEIKLEHSGVVPNTYMVGQAWALLTQALETKIVVTTKPWENNPHDLFVT